MKIVLASGNAHKACEINDRLRRLGIEAVPQSCWQVAEVEETGLSFVENALIKARNAAACTGLPALADDSGIEVDALDGAPGVYSARFAGEPGDAQKNLQKLLETLKDVPPGKRGARFVCVIAYLRNAVDATPIICEAYWPGCIAFAPKGANGFGYDPIFRLPELDCTVAELSNEQKNRLSHRARALIMLEQRLQENANA